MLRIALTGGIAVGKSTVCELFAYYGVSIIDADVIASKLVDLEQGCLVDIIQAFGDKILLDNGNLDRSQLRQLIFSNYKARQQLEEILHPKINEQLILKSEITSSYYCILSVPLLIEFGIRLDRILLIGASTEFQLIRVCQRDNISVIQAKAIIFSQLPLSKKIIEADDIIINNRSFKDLRILVDRIHKKYINIAKAIL